LAEPKPLTPKETYQTAKEHFENRFLGAAMMLETAILKLANTGSSEVWLEGAAFSIHQAIEHAYATLLLVLTNYSPPSHKLTFLRALAEDQDRRLAEAWPREQQRHRAWFNTLNEAYVKARYSKHYVIGEEALVWLGERTAGLHRSAELICLEHLERLKERACA
jgi:HEPN domain-containing protein